MDKIKVSIDALQIYRASVNTMQENISLSTNALIKNLDKITIDNLAISKMMNDIQDNIKHLLNFGQSIKEKTNIGIEQRIIILNQIDAIAKL